MPSEPGAGRSSPATPTRWLEDEQQAAWRRTIAGAILLVDQLDRELRVAHDLTLADYEILAHLSEAPDDRLRMSELADAALVSRSRLTHRVDRLAARGLVAREACPTDKRGTFAVLTPAGRSAIVAAAPTHVEGVRRYLVDRLDPDLLIAVGEGLGKAADAVRDAGAAPPEGSGQE